MSSITPWTQLALSRAVEMLQQHGVAFPEGMPQAAADINAFIGCATPAFNVCERTCYGSRAVAPMAGRTSPTLAHRLAVAYAARMRKRLALLPVFLPLVHLASACAPQAKEHAREPSPGAATATSEDRLPEDPELVRGRLENGLSYYLSKNGEPRQRAELLLIVRAGAAVEDDDQRGLAHVLEHMAFNGTARYPATSLVAYLQSLGIKFGSGLNAQTGFDETIYRLEVPTDTPAALRTGLEVLADWAGAITLAPDEVERERGVILEEWRQGRGAGRRVGDKLLDFALAGSRYPERVPIGTEESLRAFTRDGLARFYRDWYRPDLMAVVAVGDFELREVETRVREVFAKLQGPPAPRARPELVVPIAPAPRFGVFTDQELTQTSVSLSVVRNEHEENSLESYRRALAAGVALFALNERFAELSRMSEAPFLMAQAGDSRFNGSTCLATLQALTREGGAPAALTVLATELERVRRHGVGPQALARARARMLRMMESAKRERGRLESGGLADELRRAFLYDEPVPGVDAEYDLYQRLLPQIDAAEARKAIAQLFPEVGRMVAVTAPAGQEAGAPAEAELRAALASVVAAEVPPIVEETPAAALLDEPPAPGRIVAERAIAELGVTEWTLSNNVRVILKPTDFKSDEVLLEAVSWGGTSLATDAELVPATTATMLASESGLGRFKIAELMKMLSGRKVGLRPWMSSTQEGLRGAASPDDLETLLQLVRLQMTAARFDEEGLSRLRALITENVRNRAQSPEEHFRDVAQLLLWQNHPRMRPTTLEDVARLDLPGSAEFYARRFGDADDFVFVLVGALDPVKVRPLVERYLATLPARPDADVVVDRGITPASGSIDERVEQGVEPKATVELTFSEDLVTTSVDRRLLRHLIALVRDVLRDELREKLSGTYGVGVSPVLELRPKERLLLTVSFGCDPSRVDELTQAALSILKRLREKPESDSRVAQLKATALRSYEAALRENSYWAQSLTTSAANGDDPRDLLLIPQELAALTPERLQRAAARFLDVSHQVRVVLLPAAAGAASPAGAGATSPSSR